ncbi:tyrosine-type recombinase/integrase [Acidithiobacillus ferriphilus]|uniref:tyrosine-type recombinase/integrase n=1 Tax=Acidithiobacillus ferriphilus TaxID=1689834 RepID=UPI001C0677A8|nr:tyrosine-type recombinase/integrase [Acidithiobacillus ferriphilus]
MSPPNHYLRYIATVRGRTRSAKTWQTYGSNLLEYFAFLEANGLDWNAVSQGQIAAWRDAMLERGCARSTVNQRLRSVHAFYDWSVKSGTATVVPFSKQDIWVAKPRGFLAHVDAKGGRLEVNALTLKTYDCRPQFLLLEKAIRFLEETRPRRLQLMGYLMLLTGMRREEVTALDYRVVPNPAGRDPGKQIPMVLDASMTPTKGNKTRTVMLPYDLAVALHEYFTFVWPKLLALHRKKYKTETTRFFLSRKGDPLSIKGVNNAFAKVSMKTGIPCHPHLLRHTYGTYELLRMLRTKGESQALLWVKDRMGHSSITTTEQYIHAADLIQHDDIDGYIADVCRSLSHGH